MPHFDMGRAVRSQERMAAERRSGTKARIERARAHGESVDQFVVPTGTCEDCGTVGPMVNLGHKEICDACEDANTVDRHMSEGLRGVAGQALSMGLVAVVATGVSVFVLPGKLELGLVLVVLAMLAVGFGYRAWRSGAKLRFTEGVLDVPVALVWYVRLAGLGAMTMGFLSSVGILWQFLLPLVWVYLAL